MRPKCAQSLIASGVAMQYIKYLLRKKMELSRNYKGWRAGKVQGGGIWSPALKDPWVDGK